MKMREDFQVIVIAHYFCEPDAVYNGTIGIFQKSIFLATKDASYSRRKALLLSFPRVYLYFTSSFLFSTTFSRRNKNTLQTGQLRECQR